MFLLLYFRVSLEASGNLLMRIQPAGNLVLESDNESVDACRGLWRLAGHSLYRRQHHVVDLAVEYSSMCDIITPRPACIVCWLTVRARVGLCVCMRKRCSCLSPVVTPPVRWLRASLLRRPQLRRAQQMRSSRCSAAACPRVHRGATSARSWKESLP